MAIKKFTGTSRADEIPLKFGGLTLNCPNIKNLSGSSLQMRTQGYEINHNKNFLIIFININHSRNSNLTIIMLAVIYQSLYFFLLRFKFNNLIREYHYFPFEFFNSKKLYLFGPNGFLVISLQPSGLQDSNCYNCLRF